MLHAISRMAASLICLTWAVLAADDSRATMPTSATATTGAPTVNVFANTRYAPQDDAIVGHNGVMFGNRPLYCHHIPAVVLAGDIYDDTPIWPGVRKLKGAYYLLSLLNPGRAWRAWRRRKQDITAIPGLLPQQTEY